MQLARVHQTQITLGTAPTRRAPRGTLPRKRGGLARGRRENDAAYLHDSNDERGPRFLFVIPGRATGGAPE